MHSRAVAQCRLLANCAVRNVNSMTLNPVMLSTEASTHFGFQTVREADKEGMVKQVFRDVAESYDVMNDFMSAGLHRLWKDEFVRQLGPLRVSDEPVKVLDVAGGTGDIAFRILEGMRTRHRAGDGNPPSEVAILDINDAMLGVGQQRAVSKGYTGTADAAIAQGDAAFLSWHQGDAMDLQFPDNTFDAYTIAFGIRNVTRVQDAVDEAYRVLKPGGRFMCLEFSKVPVPGLSQLYDAYSFNVIPALGEVVAGNRGAYQYLVESIRKFPDQDTFAGMISSAGFQNVRYENFTAGVCAAHSGFKPIGGNQSMSQQEHAAERI